MVRRKAVKPLRTFCLQAIPGLIKEHVRRMAQKASAMQWYSLFEGNANVDKEEVLRQQVELSKKYIYENIIWYDHEEVFEALLLGVEEAVAQTRRGWSPKCDMKQYRQEMEAMGRFTEIVLFKALRKMDFRIVPKVLRSRIVDNFGIFENVRVLVISAGTGGQWMFKSIAKSLASGLERMTHIAHFSCKYDCSHELLEVLSRRCGDSLRVLDVESAKGVDDKSLGCLSCFLNLEELNIFGTHLGDEAIARLLLNLSKLTRLVRGDFLCDALGWIDYLDEVESPKLLLTEFFPSQKYYFHEEWQMEMASRMCPFISKMFFIFHEKCVKDYLILREFEYITELCLFGGSFYKDKIAELLETRGVNLTKLSLINVDKVDYLAVSHLSQCCPNLKSLSLSSCDLGDFVPGSNPDADVEYERRQNFLSMVRTAHGSVQIFGELEEVTIYSKCRAVYLSFLLGRCPNVRTINLGQSTKMDDEVLLKIYAQHGLHFLEEFHCEASSGLSMSSVQLLLNGCERLRSIGDIQGWTGIAPKDVGKLRQRIFEENLDLDARSHQKLRHILEMRDFERRTYMNLMAGPALERIRMAERDRQEEQEE